RERGEVERDQGARHGAERAAVREQPRLRAVGRARVAGRGAGAHHRVRDRLVAPRSGDLARALAAVAVHEVAVVARLARGHDAVAARGDRAVGVAAVAADRVAVVARLAGVDPAVAARGQARGLAGAGRIGAVGQAVAVLVAGAPAVLDVARREGDRV